MNTQEEEMYTNLSAEIMTTPDSHKTTSGHRSTGSTLISVSRMTADKLLQALQKLDQNNASPDTARIFYLLGKAYQKQDEQQPAIEYLNKALTMYRILGDDTNSIHVLNQLSVVYLAAGNADYADSSLEQALETLDGEKVAPEHAETHYHIGLLRQAQKNYIQAIESFKVALTISQTLDKADDSVAQIHRHLGVVYWERGEYALAHDEFIAALTILGQNEETHDVAEIYDHLGLIHQAQTNLAQAIIDFNRSLTLYRKLNDSEIDFDAAHVLHHLGGVHLAQGNLEYASSCFDQALTAYGTHTQSLDVADIYLHLGLIHQTQNEHLQATSDFNQALTILRMLENDDDSVHALKIAILLNKLGQSYQAQRNNKYAISSLQQALESYALVYASAHQDVADIHHRMGEIYLADNDIASAKASLSLALIMKQAVYPEDSNHPAITATQGLLKRINEMSAVIPPATSPVPQRIDRGTTEDTVRNPLLGNGRASAVLQVDSQPASSNLSNTPQTQTSTHYGAISRSADRVEENNSDGFWSTLCCCFYGKSSKPAANAQTADNTLKQRLNEPDASATGMGIGGTRK